VTFANIFQPLIDFFEWILVAFHDSVGLSWGWSIIAMTVVVRAALLPLTFKQFKSMQALASHAPEMKKLQDRYKHDKERLNQEMMKFYRENKINPFASCLRSWRSSRSSCRSSTCCRTTCGARSVRRSSLPRRPSPWSAARAGTRPSSSSRT
jgi:hypothetical protein